LPGQNVKYWDEIDKNDPIRPKTLVIVQNMHSVNGIGAKNVIVAYWLNDDLRKMEFYNVKIIKTNKCYNFNVNLIFNEK
jgi:hypothetical protein